MNNSPKTIKIFAEYKKFIDDKTKYKELYDVSDTLLQRLWTKILFEYQKSSKCKWTNFVHFNVAKIISHYLAKWVIWVWFEVDYWDDALNKQVKEYEKKNRIRSKILHAVREQSYLWYSILRGYMKWDDFRIVCIPHWYYYPWELPDLWESFEDLDKHFIITHITDEWKKKIRLLGYEFDNESKKWTISKEEHKDSFFSDTGMNSPYFIKRDEWTSTAEISDELPLYFLNNEYQCSDNQRWFGDSDLKSIYWLIIELLSKISMISLEFINNFESKLSVPASLWQALIDAQQWKKKWWERDMHDLPELDSSINLFFHENWEQIAQYIQKDWTYLDKAFERMKKIAQFISADSDVPVSQFWEMIWSANEPADKSQERKEAYIDRVNEKRELIEPVLEKIYKHIALYQFWKDITPIITFNPIIQDEYDSNMVLNAQAQRVISKEMARKTIFNLDDKEEEEEKLRLSDEFLTDAQTGNNFGDLINI